MLPFDTTAPIHHPSSSSSYTHPPSAAFPSSGLSDLFPVQFYPWIIFRWWLVWVVSARLTEGALPNGRCYNALTRLQCTVEWSCRADWKRWFYLESLNFNRWPQRSLKKAILYSGAADIIYWITIYSNLTLWCAHEALMDFWDIIKTLQNSSNRHTNYSLELILISHKKKDSCLSPSVAGS